VFGCQVTVKSIVSSGKISFNAVIVSEITLENGPVPEKKSPTDKVLGSERTFCCISSGAKFVNREIITCQTCHPPSPPSSNKKTTTTTATTTTTTATIE
jgi:hypothetical protein